MNYGCSEEEIAQFVDPNIRIFAYHYNNGSDELHDEHSGDYGPLHDFYPDEECGKGKYVVLPVYEDCSSKTYMGEGKALFTLDSLRTIDSI